MILAILSTTVFFLSIVSLRQTFQISHLERVSVSQQKAISLALREISKKETFTAVVSDPGHVLDESCV